MSFTNYVSVDIKPGSWVTAEVVSAKCIPYADSKKDLSVDQIHICIDF